jgi:hypothetical protein
MVQAFTVRIRRGFVEAYSGGEFWRRTERFLFATGLSGEPIEN